MWKFPTKINKLKKFGNKKQKFIVKKKKVGTQIATIKQGKKNEQITSIGS